MFEDKRYFTKQNYIKKQIQDLIPGDILLHPIYRSDGLMLINENKNLNISLINIMKKHILPDASVLVAPSVKDFEEFLQNNGYVNTAFKKDLNEIMKKYKNVPIYEIRNHINSNTINPITSMLSTSPYWASLEDTLESENLRNRAIDIKSDLLTLFSNNNTFISLFNKIKDYDDILLIHSINTTCISLLIGLTVELTNDDLIDLAIAGLFLNIGFTELPKKEYKDFLKNQEYNHPAMKKHLEVFSNMTSNSTVLRKKSIITGILDHHESYNGNGYPNGKKGEEISLFGRILHIAHEYDDLVGGYNYTTGLLPSEAIRFICENKDEVLDNNILGIFLHRTTHFKLNKTIYLPNGITGKIIDFDNYVKYPYLPIIQLENGNIINLTDNTFYSVDSKSKI